MNKEKINHDRKSRAANYKINDLVLEVHETGKIVKIRPANRNSKSD
jgi:hypothetical protein